MNLLQNLFAIGLRILQFPIRLISRIFHWLLCRIPGYFGWRRLCLNQKESFDWTIKLLQGDDEARQQLKDYFKWHFKEVLFCVALAVLISSVDKVQQFFMAFALDIKETEIPPSRFAIAFFGNGIMIFWLCYIFWHKPKGSLIPAQILGKVERGLGQILRFFVRYKVKGYVIDKEASPYGLFRSKHYHALRYKTAINRWRLSVTSSMPLLLAGAGLGLSLLRNEGLATDAVDLPPVIVGLVQWMIHSPLLSLTACTVVYLALAFMMQPRPTPNASINTHHNNLGFNLLLLFGFLILLYFSLLNYVYMKDYWGLCCKTITLLLLTMAPPLAVAHVLNSLSECMVESVEILRKPKKHGEAIVARAKTYKLVYDQLMWWSYLASGIILLLLNMEHVTTTESFSGLFFPLATLLFITIAYYQAIDWLSYNLSTSKFYVVAGIMALLVLRGPQAHFDIHYTGEQMHFGFKRATMEEYFLQWTKARFEDRLPGDTSQYIVYLTSAEGGGSRAGAWTSALLTAMDDTLQGAFRQHCFAISSVSGGSVGAAATLAWWDNAATCLSPGSNLYADDSARVRFVSRIFGRNYISTALAGLFFYDGFQQNILFEWMYDDNHSRTDRLQAEENDAVQLALLDVMGTAAKLDYLKTTNFLAPYYYPGSNKPKPTLPLFFPNTCRVEEGRRGVVSPVVLNTGNCALGVKHPGNAGLIDLLRERGAATINRLSLGGAAGLSELFPFVNATVHIDNQIGTFMDGGVYENMGLTTLYEIRAALDAITSTPNAGMLQTLFPDTTSRKSFRNFLKKLDFKIVMIYNSQHPDHETQAYHKRPLQFFDPITGLLQTPFGGHTDYIYHQTKNDFGKSDFDIIEFPLLTNEDFNSRGIIKKPTDPIIMSRWLSKHELREILERARRQVAKKLPALQH